MTDSANRDPQTAQYHQGQPILTAGEPISSAKAAMILVHGRGGSAADILTLASELSPTGFAYFAPQAAMNTWYPNRFMESIDSNEPWLSSGLGVIAYLLASFNRAGMPPERVVLLGFSQGACLTLEFAARNARHYGGVMALSGGLIGPDGTPRDYAGSFESTPIFLGCSDIDPHIPKQRVEDSAEIMRTMDANVTLRLYPNMGHTVNIDELTFVRETMAALLSRLN